MKKKLPLYVKILIGMVLGVIFSLLATNLGFESVVSKWIKPFGTIFMRLLKFIAVPLVFVSLIKGVANLGNIRSLSSIGLKTIGIYIVTTVAAIFIGLTLANVMKPGELVSQEAKTQLQNSYSHDFSSKIANVGDANSTPLQPLIDIFPENMIQAFGSNNLMLQVIFISIIFGIGLLMIGSKNKILLEIIDSCDALLLKIIDVVMLFAPIGVFALISGVVVDSAGDVSILSALGYYALTVVLGLLILILLFYPLLVKLFTKIPALEFLKKIIPVQLLAFSTSSSAATLPLTMDTTVNKLGVSQKTASFVLPVGVTINMDGTSCYQVIATIFIAQVMGIDISFSDMALLVGITTLSSIGTPGIPGGSIVVQVMVLTTMGIPAEGLALILGIDRPLDMMRTMVNVTGDMTVSTIVDQKTS